MLEYIDWSTRIERGRLADRGNTGIEFGRQFRMLTLKTSRIPNGGFFFQSAPGAKGIVRFRYFDTWWLRIDCLLADAGEILSDLALAQLCSTAMDTR